jgi:medium-chain acyl-[acyl-carrier-protein] hydrolase
VKPMVCFPHAGGTAAAFRRWPALLGDLVEVVAVELPGRGTRHAERPPATVADAFAAALAAVPPGLPAGGYVLFGHSLGALYAFEVARHLAAAGRPPALLVVSGRNGPSRPAEIPPLHQLPDGEFLDRLASFGGIPDLVRNEPDLLRLFLPVLRADLRAAETYTRTPGAPLPCPILAVHGTTDPLVSGPHVAAWQDETTAACTTAELPGGHFCLDEPFPMARFRHALATALSAPASPRLTSRR